MLNKRGFTLVEVLISAVILSVTVFGVLRLANNNSNQVTIIERDREMYDIFYDSAECVKSFGFAYLSGNTNTQSLNFGVNNLDCLTGSYNSDLTFSGIILKTYNDSKPAGQNEYFNYFKTNTGTNSVTINDYISDGTNTKQFDFTIYK